MKNQSRLLTALTSQVGRKLLTGVTGVLLVLYLIAHISGNLSLLSSDKTAFNKYGHFLHGFGSLFLLVEIALGLTILAHAYIGIAIWLRKRKARKEGYAVYASKGGPSKQSISSRTMAITGTVMLVFIVIHVLQFRFGPGIEQGYVQMVNGEAIQDLYRITRETFANPFWVAFYVGSVLLVGFHLRHGIWSALQSLGAMRPRASATIYTLALLLGVLLAALFILLPIWMYLQHRGVV